MMESFEYTNLRNSSFLDTKCVVKFLQWISILSNSIMLTRRLPSVLLKCVFMFMLGVVLNLVIGSRAKAVRLELGKEWEPRSIRLAFRGWHYSNPKFTRHSSTPGNLINLIVLDLECLCLLLILIGLLTYLQEPEDVGPTRLVGYFFLTWIILSITLSVAFNR